MGLIPEVCWFEDASNTLSELVVPVAMPSPETSLSPLPCRERRARRLARYPGHAGPKGGVCPGDHPRGSPAPAGGALPAPGSERHAPHPQLSPRIPRLHHPEQLPRGKRQENITSTLELCWDTWDQA